MASQTYTENKERFRDGDGDGEEEEDGEEMLDPRVKVLNLTVICWSRNDRVQLPNLTV